MNADAMVKAALNWTNVPEASTDSVFSGTEQIITTEPRNSTSGIGKSRSFRRTKLSFTHFDTDEKKHSVPFDDRNLAMVRFEYSGRIRYLEHVEVTVNIEYTIRGALSFYLTSPGGKC